jgi:hypothetical protein
VPEPKGPLRLRFSDGVHDMPAKKGSGFVPRREAKRKDEEVNSEEDEDPAPKRPRSGPLKPSAIKPTVEISGPSLATSGSPVIEMVGLLRELVGEVREVKKAVRSVLGLMVEVFQQNAKLVRLGEHQS